MTVENDDDLIGLKAIGAIVRNALQTMTSMAEPGMTAKELDQIGQSLLELNGAQSAPQKAYDFPGATCISVNEVVAHGVPNDYIFQAGDLINVDVSAEKNGYWADTGATFVLGKASPSIAHLLHATQKCQRTAMFKARKGRRINDIARHIENTAKAAGYNQIEGLNGHGLGRFIHEEPTIWNTVQPQNHERLQKGQVIAIEPFFTFGDGEIYEQDDGWSLATFDGAPTAQFEHSLIVTDGAPIILTI
ncbi:MAG: type I methionyl aminopeptidase [Sphingomonadales bacterium]|jgi:methionyl aminopeptidase